MSKIRVIINEDGVLENINVKKSVIITELNLSFKNIYSINKYVFFNEDNTPKFPDLKILNLSNNNLSDLSKFHDLLGENIFENLEILNLNNNEISLLNHNYFAKLPRLKQLFLEFNKINLINTYSFSLDKNDLPDLEYIYLNNNYISKLTDDLTIIKSNTPFSENETYTLTREDTKSTLRYIHENSIFSNLNDNVIIDLNNNFLIKCDVSGLKVLKIKNCAFMYNIYLTYYYQHPRLLFKRYENHNTYINNIERNGINTFIDYFTYFIYKSLPSNKKDIYLSYFFILNSKKDSINNISETYDDENYFYTYSNDLIDINDIINNIKEKKDITNIYKKDLNEYIDILFKINNDFYKQNNSIILNKIKYKAEDKNEIEEDKDKSYENKYFNDYLYRTFLNFNDILYNLNSNIYLENSNLIYTNNQNILFINHLYIYYNYSKVNTSNFLTKNELNNIFSAIIINFNEIIKNYSNELKRNFTLFNEKYVFPKNVNHINNSSNTIKYYKAFKSHISFLEQNIQYIVLDEDDWNLIFKEEYTNNYLSILTNINQFIEHNHFYLYILLIHTDEFMRYYKNDFFQNIIDLYKKCALNLYIKNSKNKIFNHLLKYLHLYDTNKNQFNINHLSAIQIDSLIDYYVMYMDELYNNFNIINNYIFIQRNVPIILENVSKVNDYIKKYLFIGRDESDIQLYYNGKVINKYFLEDYIKIYFDKFRIISGHGTTFKDTLTIIPEKQTVHFLVKSKINLKNINLDGKQRSKYHNQIPYKGLYQRGFDNFEDYYITRPLYKTQKYNSGMLCESYYIDPRSVYERKNKKVKNNNFHNALQVWRHGGIFKIENIFKNICKMDSYIKYANPINRKNNIFINSIYENIKNNYNNMIDYTFIVNQNKRLVVKELYNEKKLSSLNTSNLSNENIERLGMKKRLYNKIATYKKMYIDFLEKILFAESDTSYFDSKEMMFFYLIPNSNYNEFEYKLINFLKKNKMSAHTYFIHMCRGYNDKSNNKLLKHILKNILKLHLLVESKKRFIHKLVIKKSGLIKRNLPIPLIENNPVFLEHMNIKGVQLLNKNNSQISLSTQFSEDHFDINNYNLYKIYEDMSHMINIYEKNYPKEQLRNNYTLNIIVEGLNKLYNFIYESYEISYEEMYSILKKLLMIKKLVFTHIDVVQVEGVNRRVNISQSYKKENGTNILQFTSENKATYNVPKNIKLMKKFTNHNVKNVTKINVRKNRKIIPIEDRKSKEEIQQELKHINLQPYRNLINTEFTNYNKKRNSKIKRAQNII